MWPLTKRGSEYAMLRKKITRRLKCYLTAAAILFAGLVAALAIYLNAPDASPDALGYRFVDGVAYEIQPGDSKMYRHDLEVFGGKAAVFADELDRWFSGLWKGKRLAKTVAILSLVLALGFFRAGWICGEGADDERER